MENDGEGEKRENWTDVDFVGEERHVDLVPEEKGIDGISIKGPRSCENRKKRLDAPTKPVASPGERCDPRRCRVSIQDVALPTSEEELLIHRSRFEVPKREV